MIRSREINNNIAATRKRPPPVAVKKKYTTSYKTSNGNGNAKDLQATFALLDTNKDGRVDANDITNTLYLLGYEVNGSCVADLVKETACGKQYLNQTEFVSMVDRITQTNDISILKYAFEALDRDKDGYISECDLREGLRLMGEYVSDDVIGLMIAVADSEHTGSIGYDDFVQMMKTCGNG